MDAAELAYETDLTVLSDREIDKLVLCRLYGWVEAVATDNRLGATGNKLIVVLYPLHDEYQPDYLLQPGNYKELRFVVLGVCNSDYRASGGNYHDWGTTLVYKVPDAVPHFSTDRRYCSLAEEWLLSKSPFLGPIDGDRYLEELAAMVGRNIGDKAVRIAKPRICCEAMLRSLVKPEYTGGKGHAGVIHYTS